MIQEALRKMKKNLVIIIVAFLSGLYLIGLNLWEALFFLKSSKFRKACQMGQMGILKSCLQT